MKQMIIAVSLVLATTAAPAMALGIPVGNLTPTLTFPDQPSDQVSQEKTTVHN